MVYTANWGIIWYLPPTEGTRKLHWCVDEFSNEHQRWSLPLTGVCHTLLIVIFALDDRIYAVVGQHIHIRMTRLIQAMSHRLYNLFTLPWASIWMKRNSFEGVFWCFFCWCSSIRMKTWKKQTDTEARRTSLANLRTIRTFFLGGIRGYCILGGGFNYFLCSFLLGEDEPILTNIFQMGWFNHQLVTSISLIFFRWSNVSAFQFLNVFFRCPADIWKCSTFQVDIDTLRFHRWLKLNHLKVDTVDEGHPAPPQMYKTL